MRATAFVSNRFDVRGNNLDMTDAESTWPSFAPDGTLAELRDMLETEENQGGVDTPSGREALLHAVILHLADVERDRQDLEARLSLRIAQLESGKTHDLEERLARLESDQGQEVEARLTPRLAQLELHRGAVAEHLALIKQELLTARQERNTTSTELTTWVAEVLALLHKARLMSIHARSTAYRAAGKTDQAILDLHRVETAVGETVETTQGIVAQMSGEIAGVSERLDASVLEVAESQRVVADLANSLEEAIARARLAEERARTIDQLASDVDELAGEVQASAELARGARATAEQAKSHAESSTKAADESRAELDSKISATADEGTLRDEAYRARLVTALRKIELEDERKKQQAAKVPEDAGPKTDSGYADKYRDRWQQHVQVQAEQRQHLTEDQR